MKGRRWKINIVNNTCITAATLNVGTTSQEFVTHFETVGIITPKYYEQQKMQR
jgi:hypothetical protein